MSFSLINGFEPRKFDEILLALVQAVNAQFESNYTTESIVGTNIYKAFYGGIQEIMTSENYTAEIAAFMGDYIRTSNEKINLPKSTADGFIQAIKDEMDLDVSLKPITQAADAGKLNIALDIDDTTDDYEVRKQTFFNKCHAYLTAGLYYSGGEQGSVVALNGQEFDYAFKLPAPVEVQVRIAVGISTTGRNFVMNENQIRDLFVANFKKMYRLGFAFEPERYLSTRDLPFAADVKVEWSIDDITWQTVVMASAYDEKVTLGQITVTVQ